ncbi:hypothetical protein ACFL3J_01590 [Candidatus Omnitrophota bacterium]
MKKCFIFSIILVSAFLCVTISYSQEFTQRETQIYYDLVTEQGTVEEVDLSGEQRVERFKKIDADIASKYNISARELSEIENKAFYRKLTEKEMAIAAERNKRVDALTDNYTDKDYATLLKEVGDKYGVSPYVVEEINGRWCYKDAKEFWEKQDKLQKNAAPAPGAKVYRYKK